MSEFRVRIFAALAIVFMIAIIYMISSHAETFQSSRERSAALFEWFRSKKNGDGTFREYKNSVSSPSIVDYDTAKELQRENKFSLAELEKRLV